MNIELCVFGLLVFFIYMQYRSHLRFKAKMKEHRKESERCFEVINSYIEERSTK